MTQELAEKKFGTQGSHQQLSFIVTNALRKKFNNESSGLFNNDDFTLWVNSACEPAYQRVKKKAGTLAWQWRWGRHHYLERQSPLAKAPLIGGFFRDKKREVAGHSSSPMAESGLPVTNGANLRFLVRLTDPPELRFIIDSGNSGVVGNINAFDQAKLWHEGKTIKLATNYEEALKNAVLKIELRPN
jgi:acyl-homoserine lactone acylase PvdQ